MATFILPTATLDSERFDPYVYYLTVSKSVITMPSFRTIFLLVATTLATLALATPVVSTEGVGLIARQNTGLVDGLLGSDVPDILSDVGQTVDELLPEVDDFGAV
ncbi:hypothetical protein H2248_003532 [Termitomyces sp. 'cryptogamus']|nr:hypothetical protein H2248_007035 [Termitomyces sp. 'cryptogamus']KAH0579393.1 hypothetical protein H2248_003532 [Termitomyces sp. 'cryptogamus']